MNVTKEVDSVSFLLPECGNCKILQEAIAATTHLPARENKLAIPHIISCQKSTTGIGGGLPARDFEIIWKQKGFSNFVKDGGHIEAQSVVVTVYGLGRTCPHDYGKIPEMP